METGSAKPSLSEPLLPVGRQSPETSRSARASKDRMSPSKNLVSRPMSFPFSNQELLADAKTVSTDFRESLETVSNKFDFKALPEHNSASITLQTERVQRTRQVEMTVPTVGPSWQQASVTIATTLIGAGVLGLPYAMRRAGWIGFFLMLFSTVIASFTAKQLVWSFNTINARKLADPEKHLGSGFVRTYDQLAEEVLGPRGGGGMQVLTILECYGCAICYVVLHAVNWPVVLSLPSHVLGGMVPAPVACVSVWACGVLPLLLIQPRLLSYFASIGLFAICSLFLVNVIA